MYNIFTKFHSIRVILKSQYSYNDYDKKTLSQFKFESFIALSTIIYFCISQNFIQSE